MKSRYVASMPLDKSKCLMYDVSEAPEARKCWTVRQVCNRNKENNDTFLRSSICMGVSETIWPWYVEQSGHCLLGHFLEWQC